MSIHRRLTAWIATLVLLAALFPQSPHVAGARNRVTFAFAKGVSGEDRTYIKEGIRSAQDYFVRTFGFEVTYPVSVDAQSSDGIAGATAGHGIVFNTGSTVWSTTSPLQKVKIAVHEYFHVLEQELATQGRPYSWMFEGAAEFVAYQAVIDLGLITKEEVVAAHEFNLAHSPGRPELQAMETSVPPNAGAVYSQWYLAVDLLTEQTGPASIVEYFRLMGGGISSADAIEHAFGITSSDFYAQFETYAAQVVAPGNATGRLFPPGTLNEYPADIAVGIADEQVTAGDQAIWLGYTAPSVRCEMELIAPDGESLLTYRTRSDATGVVFWLYTVYARTPAGTATVNATCGANTVSSELQVGPLR
jgi:hypothetical protein